MILCYTKLNGVQRFFFTIGEKNQNGDFNRKLTKLYAQAKFCQNGALSCAWRKIAV